MYLVEAQPISSSQTAVTSDLMRDFCMPDGNRNIASARPKLIQLDFEELAAFEQLNKQYENLGVRFAGAVALQPSNPAFAPHSGLQVLMPLANMSGITVYFTRPTRRVGGFVLSSKPVVLTAFDIDNNRLAHTRTDLGDEVATDADLSKALPHHLLEVKGRKIVKVVFESTAPFILDDFFFYGANWHKNSAVN